MKIININTDKEQYLSGETVNDIVNTLTNKEIRVKNSKFQSEQREENAISIWRSVFFFL